MVYLLKMVIFYSYVSLPEGNMKLRRDQTFKILLTVSSTGFHCVSIYRYLKKIQKAQKHVKAPSKTNTHTYIYTCIYICICIIGSEPFPSLRILFKQDMR